jgi:hypothetical protein
VKKVESEEDDEEEEEEGSNEIIEKGRTGTSIIKSNRIRSKADDNKVKISEIEERKQH